MKVKLTFLGTGTSSGVPMIACNCPVCKSLDPRDKRLRASVLVECGGLTIVVDAGPDFRQQLLRAGVQHVDAILLTHNHMDHVGGLDETRALNLFEHKPVNIYCEKYVKDSLRQVFAYAFREPRYPGSPEWHMHVLESYEPFRVYSNAAERELVWVSGSGYQYTGRVGVAVDSPAGAAGASPSGLAGGSPDGGSPDGSPGGLADGSLGGSPGGLAGGSPGGSPGVPSVEVVPIHGWHHKQPGVSVLGYRFGNIAYLTDMNSIPDSEFEKLRGLDAVTINCVKKDPHFSHFSLAEALAFFERVGARESYITHISHRLPCHSDFAAELPPHVHPAYDGLVLESE